MEKSESTEQTAARTKPKGRRDEKMNPQVARSFSHRAGRSQLVRWLGELCCYVLAECAVLLLLSLHQLTCNRAAASIRRSRMLITLLMRTCPLHPLHSILLSPRVTKSFQNQDCCFCLNSRWFRTIFEHSHIKQ